MSLNLYLVVHNREFTYLTGVRTPDVTSLPATDLDTQEKENQPCVDYGSPLRR